MLVALWRLFDTLSAEPLGGAGPPRPAGPSRVPSPRRATMARVTLTLVLGPANSAKAGAVLGAYAAAAPRGALLIVPTAADARHYVRELAGDGVALGTVTTFAGLAGEIARRAGYSARCLTALQRERVLERLVDGLGLDLLAASARGAGFAAAAGRLIAELQRALISPESFRTALRRWSARDVRRAPYAREVGRLYAAYRAELDHLGRVDADLFAWRAVDALRADPESWARATRPGRDAVFVYGFDDLTGLERDAVESLARIPGVPVTVSLTYEPGHPGLEARAETVEALRPLAEQVVELPPRDDYYAPAARAALHHLERRLFDPAAERMDPGSAVVVLEAGGERAEAEQIAQAVGRLLGDGIPAAEIAVVARHRAPVAALLRSVFAAYGIPLADPTPLRLSHTPLGRSLIAAARCALTPAAAGASDLLTYLRTPGRLERPEIADGLEATVRRAGLRSAAQARQALGWALPELDELAGAGDPAGALVALARWLFAAPHRGIGRPLDPAAARDAHALRALDAAVAELAALAPRVPAPSPGRLLRLLAELELPGATPDPLDGVRLAEPAEIRARRFRAVVICGLQEGEFPAGASPEPFLADETRHGLALDGGLALREREDSLAAERYLFYSAVSRATDRVLVSYRSADEEGNVATASPFLSDLASLWDPGWWDRRRRRLLADVTWEPERAPTDRERARALAAAAGRRGGEPEVGDRTLGTEALRRIRHTRILSPGALEAYGRCPVRWLVEREINPVALEPESEAITRGTIIHELLESLFARLGGALDERALPRAQGLLDELLAGPAGDLSSAPGAGQPEVVRAGALRAIEADLRRYLVHEARTGAGWRPHRLELRFGFDGQEGGDSLPALELTDGERRVAIRGVIDRVDVDGVGRAVVRDYKSGTPQPGWPVARWGQEDTLQVALYMLVVRELLELDPVGGLYQPLRGNLRARGIVASGVDIGTGAYDRDVREPAELVQLLADAARRAIELAEALRRGELVSCPQTCSRDGCAHPAICRSQ
jgi:ATP-dependent helicase/DNAse subunit B